MEYSLNELKKKYVINVLDGKKLGKISDVVFTLPQNCVKGFLVENGPFSLCGEKVGFSVCDIQKIGEDAVLVKLEDRRCKNSAARKGRDSCEKNHRPQGDVYGFSDVEISTQKREFDLEDGEQDE